MTTEVGVYHRFGLQSDPITQKNTDIIVCYQDRCAIKCGSEQSQELFSQQSKCQLLRFTLDLADWMPPTTVRHWFLPKY